MTYLLDTSFIINYLRRGGVWVEKMLQIVTSGPVAISVISYAELLYGTYRSVNTAREEQKLIDFVEKFSADILPLTTEVVGEYARSRYDLETKGEKLDHLDLFIAATCVAHDFVLVTDNVRHFSRISNLKLYQREKEGENKWQK